MELFAAAITFLAGVLTYLTWRNGRWMKQSHKDTVEILKKMDDTLREIARLVVAEAEKTREAIKSQT